MHWIALQPPHEEALTSWAWRALRFTPRVARLDEALVLEVSTCERLWGGRAALRRRLLAPLDDVAAPAWARGASSLVALGLLRMARRGEAAPAQIPHGLPLAVLTAAQPHVPVLERIGCRHWGELRALPRAGVARRFGAGLLRALDIAFDGAAESHEWLQLPDTFDLKLELPMLATSAPELVAAGQRLLTQLQLWLQARNRGVLALELEWALDLKRLDGRPLPSHQRMEIRTAQPTQDMAHLRRLMGEQLARTAMAAPAHQLRLRSLETLPWGGATPSLLPQEQREGERLHQLVERLSARLGEHNVRVARPREDFRPECMQRWVPARQASGEGAARMPADALYPTWLLPQPLLLEVRGEVPHYGGPLRRLTRLYRLETAWWEEGGPALRDYFIARSERAGLVWIFRERPGRGGRSRWFLQGLYA